MIIYKNSNPNFAIGKDRIQWILYHKKKKRGEWGMPTYHPNICNLLDELAETMFKKYATKIKELKDLDENVTKVYRLNAKVAESIEKTMRVTLDKALLKGV